MKRQNGLWAQVCSFEALHAAYLRARKGKRFTPGAMTFEAGREGSLMQLARELEEGAYTPGAYHTFTIHDPKPRLISAAPFRDRVVHHALVRAIEPVFEPTFIFDSYANRVGKGTHAALRRYKAWCRTYPYVPPKNTRTAKNGARHIKKAGRTAGRTVPGTSRRCKWL